MCRKKKRTTSKSQPIKINKLLEYIEKNKKITASKVAKDWGWKNTQSYYEKKERETNQYDFLLFLNEKYNISAKKIFELLEAGRLKNAL